MRLPSLHTHQIPNSRRKAPRLSGEPGSVRPGPSPFMVRRAYPGLEAVLSEMRSLVTEHKGNPQVRDKAVSITQSVPRDRRTGLPNRRNYHAIASAIYDWMKTHVGYVRDPDGIEWLQSPPRTLQNGYGDCDDQAVLAGALLSSIGVPTRFKVVKADPADRGRYSHVYLEYQAGGRWRPFDPTLHTRAGDGLSGRQIYGSRTVGLSDGVGSEGNRYLLAAGILLLVGLLGYRYYTRKLTLH